MKPVALSWLRRDLRLDDNAGLDAALQQELPVLPVFIFDTNILAALENKADRRVDFIWQRLQELHRTLQKQGSNLYVLQGQPLDCFGRLAGEFEIRKVFFNEDYEPYARQRDEEVRRFFESQGATVHAFKDQVIHGPEEVLKPDGQPYTVFTPYSKAWKKKLEEGSRKGRSNKFIGAFYQGKNHGIPELDDLGFRKTGTSWPSEEMDPVILRHYDAMRNFPAKESTRLGVHLRFGTKSIRHYVSQAWENETLLNEFIWREFFMSILYHFPHVTERPFKKKYEGIRWRNNEEEFEQWCTGSTGYPFVDAGMRELKATGFMHNRVRMVTASFLTKHLLIDYRWGEAWFAQHLLDFELSSNNGNWQWAAGCGCDAAPYFRIFNPEEQARKFDPGEIYRKKWVPEAGTPAYVSPIVDHAFARQRALETFRKALQDHS